MKNARKPRVKARKKSDEQQFLEEISDLRSIPKRYRRHGSVFAVDCDIIDPTSGGEWFPATLWAKDFLCLLIVTPLTRKGRGFCAALTRGERIDFDYGGHAFSATVVTNGTGGPVAIQAHEVSRDFFWPVTVREKRAGE